MEEMIELQGELITGGNRRRVIEEAADVLGAYLHLLVMCDIPTSTVVAALGRALDKNFTTDPSKVETKTPGFNRSNRKK